MNCHFQVFQHHYCKFYLFYIKQSIQQLLDCYQGKLPDYYYRLKSEIHQKQYLAKQIILQQNGLLDDLYYNEKGKPFLRNGNYISISHSQHWVVVVVSPNPVGVDMEQPTRKLLKVAPKFVSETEKNLFYNLDIQALQYIWTAKESIYKLLNDNKLNFKNNIRITDVRIDQNTGFAKVYNKLDIQLYYKKTDDNFLICCAEFKNE